MKNFTVYFTNGKEIVITADSFELHQSNSPAYSPNSYSFVAKGVRVASFLAASVIGVTESTAIKGLGD